MKEKIKISFKRELLAGFLTVAVLPLVVSYLFLIQRLQESKYGAGSHRKFYIFGVLEED